MQAELLKLIENFDVISFGVFDTLLLRPYLGQGDLWRDVEKLERCVQAKLPNEIAPNYLMPLTDGVFF